AIAEDAAGREELYDPGPGRDLLADRLAHLVGTVRDAADLEAVSAGGSDTPAARDDARPLNESLLYRATELDDHRAVRAEVAHRGDARSQSRARVAKGFERRERVRLSNLSAEAGLAIECQVAVAVDHARHHERAGRGSGLGALALRRLRDRAPLTDPHDLAAIDDDGRVRHRSRAIEEALDLEDSPHPAGQYRPPMPNALIDS